MVQNQAMTLLSNDDAKYLNTKLTNGESRVKSRPDHLLIAVRIYAMKSI